MCDVNPLYTINCTTLRVSMGTSITERQVAAFKLFLQRLPHGQDIDLVIKAHLLIEREVNAIACARLPNAGVIFEDSRFESINRIRLAQSLFKSGHRPALWASLIQLNKLRNRVAHSIDPKGRETLMENIVDAISGGMSQDKPLNEQFEFAMWMLHNEVSTLVEATE
jgi:hypothetical protein